MSHRDYDEQQHDVQDDDSSDVFPVVVVHTDCIDADDVVVAANDVDGSDDVDDAVEVRCDNPRLDIRMAVEEEEDRADPVDTVVDRDRHSHLPWVDNDDFVWPSYVMEMVLLAFSQQRRQQ
jgi:hypothetical protein